MMNVRHSPPQTLSNIDPLATTIMRNFNQDLGRIAGALVFVWLASLPWIPKIERRGDTAGTGGALFFMCLGSKRYL